VRRTIPLRHTGERHAKLKSVFMRTAYALLIPN
jgi:hypothetical protein